MMIPFSSIKKLLGQELMESCFATVPFSSRYCGQGKLCSVINFRQFLTNIGELDLLRKTYGSIVTTVEIAYPSGELPLVGDGTAE
jgi:hypothetical protein